MHMIELFHRCSARKHPLGSFLCSCQMSHTCLLRPLCHQTLTSTYEHCTRSQGCILTHAPLPAGKRSALRLHQAMCAWLHTLTCPLRPSASDTVALSKASQAPRVRASLRCGQLTVMMPSAGGRRAGCHQSSAPRRALLQPRRITIPALLTLPGACCTGTCMLLSNTFGSVPHCGQSCAHLTCRFLAAAGSVRLELS